jgi:hypothetical protein
MYQSDGAVEIEDSFGFGHRLGNFREGEMRYRIGLTQTVYESATVYVEADNAEDAEDLACRLVSTGEIEPDWQFVETAVPPAAVTADVAEAGHAEGG